VILQNNRYDSALGMYMCADLRILLYKSVPAEENGPVSGCGVPAPLMIVELFYLQVITNHPRYFNKYKQYNIFDF